MLYFFLFLIVLAVVLTFIYTIHRFKNFAYLKDMKKNNKKIYFLAIFLFCIMLMVAAIIDFINLFVILIHFVLISLFVDLILTIIKKGSYDIKTLIAIIITIAYLGYGFYSAYNVKKTTYNLSTSKNIRDIKIAQISDAHLGTTFKGEGFQKYILEIASENPDLLVITGDFVDDSSTKKELDKALEVFDKINLKYGVYFVFGNHDKGLMDTRDFNEQYLKEQLLAHNVKILEDDVLELGDEILLVGRQDKSVSTRKPAYSLINNLDKEKYIIVLDHQPNDYESLSKTNADLVLSGHTHGGQMIPLGLIGLMMNANDQVYGMEKLNNTNFIVSSGISSWAVKFKTGAKSEYVFINVRKNQ